MKTICDWNNCFEIGEYRAPIEKDNSKNYRLLCLKHVKEFNQNWNYFAGMTDQQVVDFLKSDMTWHKQTQSFNSSDNFFKVLWNNVLNDGINDKAFKDHIYNNRNIKFTQSDIKAFSILGVKAGLKWDKIQKKLKKTITLKQEIYLQKMIKDFYII